MCGCFFNSIDNLIRGFFFIVSFVRDFISCMCCVGLLIEQLTKGTYECMICYNVVKRETAVWNCSNCYHIYHLYCIKRWANSSTLNADSGSTGWRCPACQNATTAFPSAYLCFCGMLLLCCFPVFCMSC